MHDAAASASTFSVQHVLTVHFLFRIAVTGTVPRRPHLMNGSGLVHAYLLLFS